MTSADVVIICPDLLTYCLINWTSRAINFESSMWNGPLHGIFYLHDLLIFVGEKGLEKCRWIYHSHGSVMGSYSWWFQPIWKTTKKTYESKFGSFPSGRSRYIIETTGTWRIGWAPMTCKWLITMVSCCPLNGVVGPLTNGLNGL